MSDTDNVQKESYIDEAKRRIAHLSYKLERAEEKIRKLEYDNAELQQWTNEVCLPKLQELSNELSIGLYVKWFTKYGFLAILSIFGLSHV